MFKLFKKKEKEIQQPYMVEINGYILDKYPNEIYPRMPLDYCNSIVYKTMQKCKCKCDYELSRTYDTFIPITKCQDIEIIEVLDLFELGRHPFITKEEFLEINSDVNYKIKAYKYAIAEFEELGFDKLAGESIVRAYHNMVELRQDLDFVKGLISSGITKSESIQTLYIKRSSERGRRI
jgi:hypothetical protein